MMLTRTYEAYFDTPMGPFWLMGTENGVSGASFVKEVGEDSPDLPPVIEECRRQVVEYFEGKRTEFDVPLDLLRGTSFQRDVWEQLSRIPYGETRSYGQVAKALGRSGGARAVGGACRSNPVGVVVPCHRVIGTNGDLVGFGGQSRDLGRKRQLLDHETSGSTAGLEDFEG